MVFEPTFRVNVRKIASLLLFIVYMILTMILITLFTLSAAKNNEINPQNKEKLSEDSAFFIRGLILWREGAVIAKNNYGQMEGLFLYLLYFVREKKVRRLPGATGTTAMSGKAQALQKSLRLQSGGGSQGPNFISI